MDWSVTTPLLLLDLCLLAGLSGANILVAIVADVIMILTGLFAAFTVEEGPKWGWYAMACIAYLVVVYQLAINGRGVAMQKDKKTGTFFVAIASFTFVLWTVYPMYAPQSHFLSRLTVNSVWGVADGSRIASVDAEIIAYAVLDILAKPVFGFWLLFTHDNMSKYALMNRDHGDNADRIVALPQSVASGPTVSARKAVSVLAKTRTVLKRVHRHKTSGVRIRCIDPAKQKLQPVQIERMQWGVAVVNSRRAEGEKRVALSSRPGLYSLFPRSRAFEQSSLIACAQFVCL